MRAFVLAMMLQLMLGVASAAPLHAPETGDRQSAPGGDGDAAASQTPVVSGSVPGSNRTLDLLIEMQPRQSEVGVRDRQLATERVKRPERDAAPAGFRPSGAAFTVPAEAQPERPAAGGLFGLQAETPKPSANQAAVDWQSRPGNSPSRSGSAGPRGSDGDGAALRWWMPQQLLRWLRDNRGWVTGVGIVTLLLLIGGSMVASQRRR